jgi:hypothetical protein
MRVIARQWGRRGAGPRLAAALADEFDAIESIEAVLSLSIDAEIRREPANSAAISGSGLNRPRRAAGPACPGAIDGDVAQSRLRHFAPAFARCAMPGPLDLLMLRALHGIGVRAAVIVHDAFR